MESRWATGRGRALMVAVAAGLVAGGAVGIWLVRADRSSGSADAAQSAEPAAKANAVYPVLGDGLEMSGVESDVVPVAPLDGFTVGRREGKTLTDVVTIWMQDIGVGSTAGVSPQAPSETVHIGNRDVTLSPQDPAGGPPFDDTYEWEEGGVRVSVVGGDAAPTVVKALTVTTGLDGPRLTLAELPDGLARIVPPASPTGPPPPRHGPQRTVRFTSADTESEVSISVDEGRPLVFSQDHEVVGTNGGEGFLTSRYGLMMLDWPLPDGTHWAHMMTYGLDEEETLRVATGITFTDQATWEALYPARVEELHLAIS